MILLIISLIFKGFAVGIFLFSLYFFDIHWSVVFQRVDDGPVEKETWFWFSIFFSCHSWEPPHTIPMTCHCHPHSSQQDMVGGSPQVSAWWWERQAVLPKEVWVVHLWSFCSLQACPGVPFTCLWHHCAQNSDLPWDAVDSAREQNEFSLAFLQPGGNSKALSEPRVYRTETWSSSVTGALFAACRKLLQGRAALRINSKPFLLTKQIKSTGEREGSCV